MNTLQQRLENALMELYGDEIPNIGTDNSRTAPFIYWYAEELSDLDIIIQVTGDHNPHIFIEHGPDNETFFKICVIDLHEDELPF